MHMKLLIVTVCLLAAVQARPSVLKNDNCFEACSATDTNGFRENHLYKYKFQQEMQLSTDLSTKQSARVKVNGIAQVQSHTGCEMTISVDVNGSSSIGTERLMPREKGNKTFEALRLPLRFAFENGEVKQVCPSSSETTASLNLKRAILSQLQFSKQRGERTQLVRTDIHGDCWTEFIPESRDFMLRRADLSTCDLDYKIYASNAVKSSPLKTSNKKQTVTTGSVECRIQMTSDRNIVKEVTCSEKQMYSAEGAKKGLMETMVASTKMTLIANDATTPTSLNAYEERSGLKMQLKSNVECLGYRDNADSFRMENECLETLPTQDKLSTSAVGKAIQLLKDMSVMSEDELNINSAEKYSQLVKYLRAFTKESDFHSFKLAINEVDNRGHQIMRNVISAAFSNIGTKHSVSYLVKQMKMRRSSENFLDMVTNFLDIVTNLQQPTPEVLPVLLDYLKNRDEGQISNYQSDSYAVATLVNKICQEMENCESKPEVKAVIDFFSNKLGEKCEKLSSYESSGNADAFVALLAIGNMGRDSKGAQMLMSCITNEKIIMANRVFALQSLRRFKKIDAEAKQELLQILKNKEEDSELRIFVFRVLLQQIQKTDTELLTTIQDILTTEKEDRQVQFYIYTHLKNQKQQLLQQLKSVLSQPTVVKRMEQLNRLHFSNNMAGSYYSSYLAKEAKVDANLIYSQFSRAPRFVNLNFTVNDPANGVAKNLMEIGFRFEQIEDILEKVYDKFSKDFGKQDQRTKRSTQFELSDQQKALKLEKSSPRVDMFIHKFGNVYYHKYDTSVVNWVSEYINKVDRSTLLKTLKDQFVSPLSGLKDLSSAGTLTEETIAIPTITGAPVLIKHDLHYISKVMVNPSAKMSKAGMKLGIQVQPSASLYSTRVFSIDAIFDRIGIETQGKGYSKTGARVEVVNDSNDGTGRRLSLKVKPLVKDQEIAKFSTKVNFFGHNDEQKLIKVEADQSGCERKESKKCTGKFFEKYFGIKACHQVESYCSTTKGYASFWKTPGLVETKLQHLNDKQEFEASLQLRNTNDMKQLAVTFGDKSSAKRHFMLDLQLNQKDEQIGFKAEFKNPVISPFKITGEVSKMAAGNYNLTMSSLVGNSINGNLFASVINTRDDGLQINGGYEYQKNGRSFIPAAGKFNFRYKYDGLIWNFLPLAHVELGFDSKATKKCTIVYSLIKTSTPSPKVELQMHVVKDFSDDKTASNGQNGDGRQLSSASFQTGWRLRLIVRDTVKEVSRLLGLQIDVEGKDRGQKIFYYHNICKLNRNKITENGSEVNHYKAYAKHQLSRSGRLSPSSFTFESTLKVTSFEADNFKAQGSGYIMPESPSLRDRKIDLKKIVISIENSKDEKLRFQQLKLATISVNYERKGFYEAQTTMKALLLPRWTLMQQYADIETVSLYSPKGVSAAPKSMRIVHAANFEAGMIKQSLSLAESNSPSGQVLDLKHNLDCSSTEIRQNLTVQAVGILYQEEAVITWPKEQTKVIKVTVKKDQKTIMKLQHVTSSQNEYNMETVAKVDILDTIYHLNSTCALNKQSVPKLITFLKYQRLRSSQYRLSQSIWRFIEFITSVRYSNVLEFSKQAPQLTNKLVMKSKLDLASVNQMEIKNEILIKKIEQGNLKTVNTYAMVIQRKTKGENSPLSHELLVYLQKDQMKVNVTSSLLVKMDGKWLDSFEALMSLSGSVMEHKLDSKIDFTMNHFTVIDHQDGGTSRQGQQYRLKWDVVCPTADTNLQVNGHFKYDPRTNLTLVLNLKDVEKNKEYITFRGDQLSKASYIIDYNLWTFFGEKRGMIIRTNAAGTRASIFIGEEKMAVMEFYDTSDPMVGGTMPAKRKVLAGKLLTDKYPIGLQIEFSKLVDPSDVQLLFSLAYQYPQFQNISILVDTKEQKKLSIDVKRNDKVYKVLNVQGGVDSSSKFPFPQSCKLNVSTDLRLLPLNLDSVEASINYDLPKVDVDVSVQSNGKDQFKLTMLNGDVAKDVNGIPEKVVMAFALNTYDHQIALASTLENSINYAKLVIRGKSIIDAKVQKSSDLSGEIKIFDYDCSISTVNGQKITLALKKEGQDICKLNGIMKNEPNNYHIALQMESGDKQSVVQFSRKSSENDYTIEVLYGALSQPNKLTYHVTGSTIKTVKLTHTVQEGVNDIIHICPRISITNLLNQLDLEVDGEYDSHATPLKMLRRVKVESALKQKQSNSELWSMILNFDADKLEETKVSSKLARVYDVTISSNLMRLEVENIVETKLTINRDSKQMKTTSEAYLKLFNEEITKLNVDLWTRERYLPVKGDIKSSGIITATIEFDLKEDESNLLIVKMDQVGMIQINQEFSLVIAPSTEQQILRDFSVEYKNARRNVLISKKTDVSGELVIEAFLDKSSDIGVTVTYKTESQDSMPRTKIGLQLVTRKLELTYGFLLRSKVFKLDTKLAYDATKQDASKVISFAVDADLTDSLVASVDLNGPFLRKPVKIEVTSKNTAESHSTSLTYYEDQTSEFVIKMHFNQVEEQSDVYTTTLSLETEGTSEAAKSSVILTVRSNSKKWLRSHSGVLKVKVPSKSIDRTARFQISPMTEFKIGCDQGNGMQIKYVTNTRLNKLFVLVAQNGKASKLSIEADKAKSQLTLKLKTGTGKVRLINEQIVTDFSAHLDLLTALAGFPQEERKIYVGVFAGKVPVGQKMNITSAEQVPPHVVFFTAGLKVTNESRVKFFTNWRSAESERVKYSMNQLLEDSLGEFSSRTIKQIEDVIEEITQAAREKLGANVDLLKIIGEAFDILTKDIAQLIEFLEQTVQNDDFYCRTIMLQINQAVKMFPQLMQSMRQQMSELLGEQIELLQSVRDSIYEYIDSFQFTEMWENLIEQLEDSLISFKNLMMDNGIMNGIQWLSDIVNDSGAADTLVSLVSDIFNSFLPPLQKSMDIVFNLIDDLERGWQETFEYITAEYYKSVKNLSKVFLRLLHVPDIESVYNFARLLAKEFKVQYDNGATQVERDSLVWLIDLIEKMYSTQAAHYNWENLRESYALLRDNRPMDAMRHLLKLSENVITEWRPKCDEACISGQTYATVKGTLFSPIYIAHLNPFALSRQVEEKNLLMTVMKRAWKTLTSVSTDGYIIASAYNDWRDRGGELWDPLLSALRIRHRTALISGENNIITFDGESIQHKRPCKYLIAHDFRRNTFSIMQTYQRHPITNKQIRHELLIKIGDSIVSIDRSGQIKVNNEPQVIPDTKTLGEITLDLSKDWALNVIDARFHGKVRDLLKVRCSLSTDSCAIHVHPLLDGEVHGLVGSNNGRNFDEFQGNVEEHMRFWTAGQCLETGEATNELKQTKDSKCSMWFRQGVDSFEKCFSTVDPKPFEVMCTQRQQNDQSECDVATLYVETCRSAGVNINTPRPCVQCRLSSGKKIESENVISDQSELQKNTQVVFLFEKSECALQADTGSRLSNVEIVMRNLNNMPNTLVEYGFATFGSQSGLQVQRASSRNQEFLTGRLAIRALASIRSETPETIEGSDLLTAVSQVQEKFDWNPLAQKHLIVIACKRCSANPVDNAQVYMKAFEAVKDRIHLHVITSDTVPQVSDSSDWKHNMVGYDRHYAYFAERVKESISSLNALNRSYDCAAELALNSQNAASGSTWSIDKFKMNEGPSSRLNSGFILTTKLMNVIEDIHYNPPCKQCTCGLAQKMTSELRCKIVKCPPSLW